MAGRKSEPEVDTRQRTTPIPAPSEAQLKAGADADPNAHLGEVAYDMPPLTLDQVNTNTDGNAPHVQPDGTPTTALDVDAIDPPPAGPLTNVESSTMPEDGHAVQANDTNTATKIDPHNPSSTIASKAHDA